jgi:hypothetical protein
MKTAIVTLPGLNTNPATDCWGLRPFVENLLAAELDGTGSQSFYFAWDKVTVADYLAAVAGFDRVVAIGHSFGGGALKWLGDLLAALATPQSQPKIDLGIFLDPAPNGDRLHQFYSWQMADLSNAFRWHCPPSIKEAICFYQRNEIFIPGLAGVCGVPFHEREGVRNINVTDWGLYHCHMCGDSRVQMTMEAAINPELPELVGDF